MTPAKKPPEDDKDDDRDDITFGKFRYRGHGLDKFGWALPVALLVISLAVGLCAILFGLSKLVMEMNRGRNSEINATRRSVVVCRSDVLRDDVSRGSLSLDCEPSCLLSRLSAANGTWADGHRDCV